MANKYTNLRKTRLLRTILLVSLSILFIIIAGFFYYQHKQYKKTEKRLTQLYQNADISSSNLNQLFSIYAEAENNFRLYTINYDQDAFSSYVEQLDLVKFHIDSLSNLQLEVEPLSQTSSDIIKRQIIANEYAQLKKTMGSLIKHTYDSLQTKTSLSSGKNNQARKNPEINNIAQHQDSIHSTTKDTIIRKRKSLIKRIFEAQDDTIIVNQNNTERTNTIHQEQQRIAETQIQNNTRAITKTYTSNLDDIRTTFDHLQTKERELINTNFSLLTGLRKGIDRIREIELNSYRSMEKEDFKRYRDNISTYNWQFISLLFLMLIMILALYYYIRRTTLQENKLENEKNYIARLAEEKTSILAGVSHEVRTPLNALLGLIELLRNKSKEHNLSDDENNLIESTYYHINTISSTITDVLGLSKLESEKGNIILDYFAPTETFAKIISLHAPQAALKNILLKTDININSRQRILSNEFRIKQISSNLVGNAIKYTQKGEVLFHADIDQNKEGKQFLNISIQDTGIGIPEEKQSHIFRKYYTASSNKTSGFGLGLYITKLLTEELNAQISFVSKENKGSTFTVRIPFENSIIDEDQISYEDLKLEHLPKDLKYLIVDDNPMNILYMRQFLKPLPYVITCTNPEEVIDIISNETINIIITDLNMPNIDGWKLLDIIRQTKNTANTKVYALSAENDDLIDGNLHQTYSLKHNKFDGFIPKPFKECDFVKIILKGINENQQQND